MSRAGRSGGGRGRGRGQRAHAALSLRATWREPRAYTGLLRAQHATSAAAIHDLFREAAASTKSSPRTKAPEVVTPSPTTPIPASQKTNRSGA